MLNGNEEARRNTFWRNPIPRSYWSHLWFHKVQAFQCSTLRGVLFLTMSNLAFFFAMKQAFNGVLHYSALWEIRGSPCLSCKLAAWVSTWMRNVIFVNCEAIFRCQKQCYHCTSVKPRDYTHCCRAYRLVWTHTHTRAHRSSGDVY